MKPRFNGLFLCFCAFVVCAASPLPNDRPASVALERTHNVVRDSGTELAEKALIVMTFINGPGYFKDSAKLSDRAKINAYKREVDGGFTRNMHQYADYVETQP